MTAMSGIPFTVTQDEDGAWSAMVKLWDGVGAVGHGDTPDKAVTDCAAGLKLLCEHYAATLPGEPGHVPAAAGLEQAG
jgi:predicted RNase H-like HicB family nuclease